MPDALPPRCDVISWNTFYDLACRRVLLVEDVADSGETSAGALRHLQDSGPPTEIRSAALHYKTISAYMPDYYAHKVRNWRGIIYPWAVPEDVGSILAAMAPRPADADEAARRLPRKQPLDLLDLQTA